MTDDTESGMPGRDDDALSPHAAEHAQPEPRERDPESPLNPPDGERRPGDG